ncbi:MAG TPA: CDP-alcohol phosphatidyltransferase family protein [Chthoniobacterales bacterium]|nr:CDP-alcohol phosphatidyltransferase family protein [Chthoniobacterales bacterium]
MDQILNVWPKPGQALLVVRGDTIFDIRLLRLLSTQSLTTALVDSAVPSELQSLVASVPDTSRGKFGGASLVHYEWALAQSGSFDKVIANGLDQRTVAALDVAEQPLYYLELRREIRPFWFRAPIPENKKAAERVLLRSIQKGTQDIPALVHAPIENFLISHLCKTSITPNQLTIFCNILGWITTILLVTGRLWPGIALALIVGVLDGLDGKQARMKVETSTSGKLEHWFDAFFEWSWWIAIAYHLQISGQLPGAFRYLLLLLLAEALDGIAKGSVYFTYGKLIDELGPFERIVRLVGGRRNIYVWILAVGLVFGAPGKAFIAMASLEAATAAVHLPRAAWAVWMRKHRIRANAF